MVEPQSFVSFQPVYRTEFPGNDLPENRFLSFDFQLIYKVPVEEEEARFYYGSCRTLCSFETIGVARGWLLNADNSNILDKINLFLDVIHIPRYSDIVAMLYYHVLTLKESEVDSISPKAERVNVVIGVEVPSSYIDDVIYADMEMVVNADVEPDVPHASDEAMENHLKTVVAENDKDCAICLDEIQSGPEAGAVQMPCMHVFHRTCVQTWLRTSGTCPECRAVFPS